MLPLLILAFPQLLLVYFLVSCSYFSVSCCPSESLCNPQFNSVQLGLFFGKFQCDFYLVNTRFMLFKEQLVPTKERFTHTKSP